MNKAHTKRSITVLALLYALCTPLDAYWHSNFSLPYDKYAKRMSCGSKSFKAGVSIEHGIRTNESFNGDSKKAGAFELYSATQSSRNMLKDTQVTFPAGQDPDGWPNGITLDGPWGDFAVTGYYRQTAGTVWGQIAIPQEKVPGKVFVGVALPIRQVTTSDVVWTDLTDATADPMNQTAIDKITGKLSSYVKDVGGLDISAWSEQGAGDLSVFAGWAYDMSPKSTVVTSARTQVSLGAILPTSTERDEDKAFSTAFGHDGSYGVALATAGDISFNNGTRVGSYGDISWFASKARTRRLKTDRTQTELLLLSKGKATLKPGALLKGCLYAKHPLSNRVSVSLGYKYQHQGKGEYSDIPDGFVLTTVNSHQSLNSWTAHDLVAKLSMRASRVRGNDSDDETRVNQLKLNLFYCYPLGGTHVTRNHIVGGEISAAF
jgi:hypothetical protein